VGTPTSTTTATTAETETDPGPTLSRPSRTAGLLARARSRLATGATPTGISGPGEPTAGGAGDPVAAGTLIAAAAALLVAGAGWIVARSGRQLRRPSRRQLDDFGRPVGRILVRHFDMTRLGPDVADGIQAGIVAGDYLADGPLTTGAHVDTGLIPQDDEETIP
jgi:hypothetical protein